MDLGPTFIKFGQILSTRVDLIPPEYCDALGNLRNNVSPMPYDEVIKILKDNYDNIDDIFSYIESSPIGSASIAQVHKARLRSGGKNVILKIKRPDIERVLFPDLEMFKKAVNVLHLSKLFKVVDLNQIIDTMYDVSKEETDFSIEVSEAISRPAPNLDRKYEAFYKLSFDILAANHILRCFLG